MVNRSPNDGQDAPAPRTVDDDNADHLVDVLDSLVASVELVLIMSSSAVPISILRRMARQWIADASRSSVSFAEGDAILRCARELGIECDAIEKAAQRASPPRSEEPT